jgi:hypothetical protein
VSPRPDREADNRALDLERRRRLLGAGIALLRLEEVLPPDVRARWSWTVRAFATVEQAIARPRRS